MDERLVAFIQQLTSGSMVTVRADTSTHVARVTVGVVDGKVWATCNGGSVRSKHVRANPRATVFVFDPASHRWAGLEGKITIYDGPDAPEKCLTLRRAVGRPPADDAAYLEEAKNARREIHELTVERFYGSYA